MKVQRWGNSLGLRIPRTLAQEIDIKEGTEVTVSIDSNKALLVKPVEKKPTLEELMGKITPENQHNEIDWGKPEGKESW